MKARILPIAALLLAFVAGVALAHGLWKTPCPAPITATGKSSMTETFDDLTKVVIFGATSPNVLVECYDAKSRNRITPKSVAVDSALNVVVQFANPTTGYCTVHNTR